MMMVIIAAPILLMLLLGTVELAMRIYYRAQVRSVATAAALAAVGNQRRWSIPIPTKFVFIPWPLPVDGFVFTTISLPDIDSGPNGSVVQVKNLTNPAIQLQEEVLPWKRLASPFKWVKITASLDPPGVFSKIFKAAPLQESACAIAWVRPEYWFHGWWDKRSSRVLFGGEDPLRYYRLVPCGTASVGDILEAVVEAHLATTGQSEEAAFNKQWSDHSWETLSPMRPKKRDEEHRPKNPAEIDGCIKEPAKCREQPPETKTCESDHVTTYSVPPLMSSSDDESQYQAYLEELVAKNCPPPPPPPEPN